jgi:ATP-binding cassette, subfamily B, bacterial PglK
VQADQKRCDRTDFMPRENCLLTNLSALFERQEKWRLVGVFLAVLLSAAVEVVGVASIMPFMSLVTDPAQVYGTGPLASLFRYSGLADPRDFVILAGVSVLVAITVSNGLSAATTWLILRSVARGHKYLSKSLLSMYVRAPYSFLIGRNSSELSKNILEDTNTVMHGVVLPLMQAVAKGIVAVLLIGLLMIVNPLLAAIITVVFGGAYGAMYFAVRNRQRRIGLERLQANAQRYRVAAEVLGGIKDLKVLRREGSFNRRFDRPCDVYADHSALHSMLGLLPRYVLEVTAFGSILLIVLMLLATEGGTSSVLPVVSLYALAGYRLMPALQQIYHGISQVRFHGPVLESLHRDFAELRQRELHSGGESADAGSASEEMHVIVEDVTFQFPGRSAPALDGLSLRIPRHQAVALVGPTGAGKTTAVDVILGLLTPERGRVVRAASRATGAGESTRTTIGYVPQSIFLSDDTIRRNIALGLPDGEIDEATVIRAARVAHIDEFIASLPEGFDTVVGEKGVRLSGGQRQRLGIARALYTDPDILIMDEATSALDGATEDAVMQAVRELAGRKTLLIIAHRLSTVRECSTIYVMDQGRVIDSGTYTELANSSDLFRRMAHAGRGATTTVAALA